MSTNVIELFDRTLGHCGASDGRRWDSECWLPSGHRGEHAFREPIDTRHANDETTTEEIS